MIEVRAVSALSQLPTKHWSDYGSMSDGLKFLSEVSHNDREPGGSQRKDQSQPRV